MAFKNNNVASGAAIRDQFQIGRANVDGGQVVEREVLLPFPQDPAATWLYYDCTVGVMLDSGIVVHHRLPQVNNTYDTLSSCDINDANIDKLTAGGVNLSCKDQYADIVQRMGHARYWFRLWGQALRVVYQVPIPGIKTIGGQTAIPYDKNPQWAFNRIFPGGNFSGVILWHAQWSLWYTIATPPNKNDAPAVDVAAHIRGDAPVPKGVQAPFSQPDDNAQRSAPNLHR